VGGLLSETLSPTKAKGKLTVTNFSRVCKPVGHTQAAPDPALSAGTLLALGVAVLLERDRRRHPTVPAADETALPIREQFDGVRLRTLRRIRLEALRLLSRAPETVHPLDADSGRPVVVMTWGRSSDCVPALPGTSLPPPPAREVTCARL